MFLLCWSARRRVVVASSSCRRGVVVVLLRRRRGVVAVSSRRRRRRDQYSIKWGSAGRVRLMTCDALSSSALCSNRSFSSLTCRFAAQVQYFVSFYVCAVVQSSRFDLLRKSTLRANSLPFHWGKVSQSCCARPHCANAK